MQSTTVHSTLCFAALRFASFPALSIRCCYICYRKIVAKCSQKKQQQQHSNYISPPTRLHSLSLFAQPTIISTSSSFHNFSLFIISFYFSFLFVCTLSKRCAHHFSSSVSCRIVYDSWAQGAKKKCLLGPNKLSINYCVILAICSKKRTPYYVHNTINELNML